MLQGIFFGVVMATILDPIGMDEVRLRAERAADADVLSSLHRNGDCAAAVRSIDLRFVGSASGTSELSARSADLGFTVIQSVQIPDGTTAIDLSVESDALPSTIDRLTVTALKIEARFNLRYDGWGTVATKC
jgi:regulator of RNase E activity RraB